MLRRFAVPDENHRNIPSIAFFQNGIFIHVHFVKHRAKLAQNRYDLGLCLVAKMAARARVQRDVPRPAPRQPQIFRGIAHGWGFEYFMSLAEAGCIRHLPGQRFILLSKCFERTPTKNWRIMLLVEL